MKAVIQRVNGATLSVDGKVVSAIGRGLAVYLGIFDADTMSDVDKFCKKLVAMRIFEDENGKLNLSVRDYALRRYFARQPSRFSFGYEARARATAV